jgi:hypothetical protein
MGRYSDIASKDSSDENCAALSREINHAVERVYGEGLFRTPEVFEVLSEFFGLFLAWGCKDMADADLDKLAKDTGAAIAGLALACRDEMGQANAARGYEAGLQ